MTPRRIVHISTVHSALDPRVRLKELRTIARAGHEAHLVTADPLAREEGDGVVVHRLAGDRSNRVRRMFVLAPRAILTALRIRAAGYHIHDPELLPWAWLLLARGVPVVYDAHEDFARFMRHKPYIPAAVGAALGGTVGLVERLLSAPFRIVIAEHCYRPRFSGATAILNYPTRSTVRALAPVPRAASGRAGKDDPGAADLLYTGNLTVARGALNIVELVRRAPTLRVTCVGECKAPVARLIARRVDGAADRLRLVGEGRYVPFGEIEEHYRMPHWLAGIVLMPDSPHYRDKQLTKFFEYMAAGLPIIASDFPVWRRLIEGEGVGICVNPDDLEHVLEAVRRLTVDPFLTAEMGSRGRDLVRTRYLWERQEERLLGLYDIPGATTL